MTDAAPISVLAQEAAWLAFRAGADNPSRDATGAFKNALAAELEVAPQVVRDEFEGVAISIDGPKADPLPRIEVRVTYAHEGSDLPPDAMTMVREWIPHFHVTNGEVQAGFDRSWDLPDGRWFKAWIRSEGPEQIRWCAIGEKPFLERGTASSLSEAYRTATAAVRAAMFATAD